MLHVRYNIPRNFFLHLHHKYRQLSNEEQTMRLCMYVYVCTMYVRGREEREGGQCVRLLRKIGWMAVY